MPNKDYSKWMFRRKVPLKGDRGDQGSEGDPGPVGSPGIAGPQGPAGTMAVGTTSTLPPGSSATVSNVGTPVAAILNFGVPQGASGIPSATSINNYSALQRALGVVYQPSATRPTLVLATLTLRTQLSLIGTSIAQVDLFSDAVNPPTTMVGRLRISQTIGVGISISDTAEYTRQVIAFMQPGWYYRMVATTSNGGIVTVTNVNEVVM